MTGESKKRKPEFRRLRDILPITISMLLNRELVLQAARTSKQKFLGKHFWANLSEIFNTINSKRKLKSETS